MFAAALLNERKHPANDRDIGPALRALWQVLLHVLWEGEQLPGEVSTLIVLRKRRRREVR